MDLSHPRIIDFYTYIGHTFQNRLLLSDDASTNGEHPPTTDCTDPTHTEDHDIEEAFQHIYFVMLFLACLWFIGKVFARCGLPSLVGEIVCGIILGPNLLGFVPYSDALIVIGEIGLVLLVLEAGIDVSIGHLKVVGFRGLSVAIFGSMIPLAAGTGLATLYGENMQSAFAIGACLAPTSMGIALNVLRNAKVLNTPTGQLIIAAAVLDDVIALMLLSELEAMADPTISKILLPLIVSPAFILFFGFLAIRITPWIIEKIMIQTHKHQHENVILLLLFFCTFLLVPICFYAGSSHLLGAFLAGLMFCTDHTIHEAWNNQIKRIMQWMLRIFFACTIGFAVPIQDFWTKPVLLGAFLYFIAIIGKLLTGIFSKPLTFGEFFTIAFSMSAWGEFAFILATASFSTGTIDKDSYSSVLMAVLLSVVISPLALRFTLSIVRKQKHKRLTDTRDLHYDDGNKLHNNNDLNIHPVYFCVHTKGKGRWGHQDKLLHCIFNLNLVIIDFRAFNEAEYNYSHHLPIVQDVFYVLDKKLSLPPTKRLGKIDERKLQQRYKQIKRALKETIGDPHASIDVMRWLPGVRRTDDIQSPIKSQNKPIQSPIKIRKNTHNASYCRKEAYKQARLALDHVEQRRSSSYLVSGISRIRPSHDALHRDKFSYHGSIHTEQDDLIAMAFIDTLQSLQASLSPENRSSPTGSHTNNNLPLSHDELFAKINTLRNCVEHLQVFQPALSDDGYGNKLSNPPSIHSFNGENNIHPHPHPHHPPTTIRSFDQHYAKTFTPLMQPNISAPGSNPPITHMKKAHTDISEHGSIFGIEHKHSIHNINKSNNNNNNNNNVSNRIPPQPGLFISHSHGSLPSLNHNKHSHFNHLPRDIFPRDGYAGYGSGGGGRVHSHSREGNEHHHISSEESMSSENKSDDSNSVHRIETMYGDEDEQHRPLNLYTNLDDLDEEPQEYNLDNNRNNNNNDDDERSPDTNYKAHTTIDINNNNNNNNDNIKRSTTWSKINIFKHKHNKLSDDENNNENENNNNFKRRKGNKKKRKKKKNNNNNNELSLSSIKRKLSWSDNDENNNNNNNENNPVPVDPKMIEIPKVLITKTHKKVLFNKKNNNKHKHIKISDDDMTDENGIDIDIDNDNHNDDDDDGNNNELKPLKSS